MTARVVVRVILPNPRTAPCRRPPDGATPDGTAAAGIVTPVTRRAFLHVGSPKTGTTYLQSLLFASRPALRRQGVLLPMTLGDHFRLSLVLRDAIDPVTDDVDPDEVVESFAREIDGSDLDVLITHELLASATPGGVAAFMALLAGLEVHVVLTTRDWQRQLPAEWQQSVKTRQVWDFEEFLTTVRDDPGHPSWVRQDFAGVAALWGAGLPPERVHVVTVPPPGSPPELLRDRFCSVLGVDPATLGPHHERRNPSLTLEGTEVLRRVNAALGDRLPKPRSGYNRVARFWFAEKVLTTTSGTRLALPPAHREWCAAGSEAQVEALAGAGYDVVGDLRDLVGTPEDAGAPVPADADDAALLEVAVAGLAGALDQRLIDLQTVERLRHELRRARRELRAATAGQEPCDGPDDKPVEHPRSDRWSRIGARLGGRQR